MTRKVKPVTASILENPYRYKLRKFGDIYARGKEVASDEPLSVHSELVERQPKPGKFSSINRFK